MKAWIEPLKEMKACGDALEWCKGYESLVEAWAVCPRGDWMIWLLGKLSGKPVSDSHKKLVLTACQCARLALPYVESGELRPQRAIEAAEAWAKGEGNITLEDVINAANAADAAAHAAAYAAADAAAHAAAYAAYAAAHAAYAAAYAAAHAAYAAAYAAAHAAAYAAADAAAHAAAYAAAHAAAHAAAYAAAHAAAYATRLKTLAKCADIARQYYPVAPKLKDK